MDSVSKISHVYKKNSYQEAVLAIYDAEYAQYYPTYWNEGCLIKNAGNLDCIDDLLLDNGDWIDLCCGTGWHFGKVSRTCNKTGLDLSPEQLAVAEKIHPEATFILGDVIETEPDPTFDLVTSFWFAYGYLDDTELIAEFCRKMVGWLKPGGNLILEVGDGALVSTWNASSRAQNSIARVFPRTDDWTKWSFFDRGGVHNLTTPEYSFFDEILGSFFDHFERRFENNWCGIGRR